MPWPVISRGTEATVPSPPGLVRVMFVPTKSSAVSAFSRVLRTSSSYLAWNDLKSVLSAAGMQGTIRAREPSFFSTSTAIPRFTAPWSTTFGLPSRISKLRAIAGHSRPASTIAQAIRCVNDTFISRRATFSASLSWRRRRSSSATPPRSGSDSWSSRSATRWGFLAP